MADDPLKQPSLRLFLAIPFHQIFYQEISRILDSLRYKISGVKWVAAEQVHLTLHFFGSTPASQIEPIDAAMRSLSPFFAPMTLSLNQIGGFPALKRPNILWVGVQEKTGGLLALVRAIQKKLKTMGFAIDSRSFNPHVTIGRVKQSKEIETVLEKCRFEFPSAEKQIDHFILFQSHCLPGGARYESLKKYPFS